MIADEVQTGFARTGKVFAMDHYKEAGIFADLTTMAKGLAGGLPLSAVTGKADIMDSADPGGLGGTFAGNPLGIAAAHAVLDVIEEEKLCDRAVVLGAKLKDKLESLRGETQQIADVRGPGLMVAVEFMTAPHGDGFNQVRTWNPAFAKCVKEEALRRGLILLTCGVHANVIRFLPPVTIADEHFDEALDILAASIEFAKAEEEKENVVTAKAEVQVSKAAAKQGLGGESVPVAVPIEQ
uniref:4-aminobutyrate--2-oxoglutarate transaminase n=1 Tax=Pseudictyota dubia TaxID=2749911 RepID=A0A7R9WIX6_9STRA|mmetsp:Transcript_7015/g.12632  ORF Transcript_7015/g.12632 Transcript_7015/m.12632 type:complete len:239 (+) Transcript_7015:2-718(+)